MEQDMARAKNKLVTEAAIVLKDGTVVDPQGFETLTFASLNLSEYHIAIVHSNHLGIMTATSIDLSTDPFIDFAESSTAVYTFGGIARRDIAGTMVCWAGDANGSGRIDAIDSNLFWLPENGGFYQYGTTKSDFNLDGNINALDLNLFWRRNNSLVAQLP